MACVPAAFTPSELVRPAHRGDQLPFVLALHCRGHQSLAIGKNSDTGEAML